MIILGISLQLFTRKSHYFVRGSFIIKVHSVAILLETTKEEMKIIPSKTDHLNACDRTQENNKFIFPSVHYDGTDSDRMCVKGSQHRG